MEYRVALTEVKQSTAHQCNGKTFSTINKTISNHIDADFIRSVLSMCSTRVKLLTYFED